MSELKSLKIDKINLDSSTIIDEIKVTYQHYGKKIKSNPVVLVIHPLTGNSNVSGKNGWWSKIIDSGKVIDTEKYAVIAFNIPGNGYDGVLFKNYKDFNTGDIAKIFFYALRKLKINNLYAAIGGSIGAGIVWELAALYPKLIKNLIPVAGDWKSSDWMIANTTIQSKILDNSSNPIEDARMHAMLCYRTPKSFKIRFSRSFNKEKEMFNVQSWLIHHGNKLKERYELKAYKMMNHLLGSIDVTRYGSSIEEILSKIDSKIHIISIDSDLFFPIEEDFLTIKIADSIGVKIEHKIVVSDYGHDAFLMESEKISKLLKDIF